MNQSPPTEKQTGKRIVSKGAYAKAQSKRISIGFSACCSFVLMGMSVLLALVCCAGLAVCMSNGWDNETKLIGLFCLGGLVILLPLSYFSAKLTQMTYIRARQIDPGVPLTHANTASLPASDSLVRASEQPMQEQQAVLLRAATEGVERHEEQLVRAVVES